MSGKIYDQNLLRNDTASNDTVDWHKVTCENFDIYGLIPEKDGLLTRRMPTKIAETVNKSVLGMCGYGAGGRILFSTNSPFIAIKVEFGEGSVPTVCNHCYSYGFDLYKFDESQKDVFVGVCRPTLDFDYHTNEFLMQTKNDGIETFYTINLPHFSEIKTLYIGIEKGRKLGKGRKYRNDKPVVFYGSSITHGVAAGRPGNTYQNFISQKYNLDYINLGFSGAARGEQTMAEYVSKLDMCAFVCDYDHNAPNVQHLKDTHFKFYETFRKNSPDVPYIMISRPTFFQNPIENDLRRKVIIESYQKAKELGDNKVYFIDGETLFEGDFYRSCTSDGVHPNDLGFFRMADKIGSVIADALGIK